jgi:enoyl-[acyl-carrier protein] reductase II
MALFGAGKMYKAFVDGDAEEGSVMAGQICGMIEDIPTVKELIERMVKEAEGVLSEVKHKVFP